MIISRKAKDFSRLSYLRQIGLVVACLISSSPLEAQIFQNQSDFIKSSDYPTNSLKRAEEGITGYRLTLDINGRPTSCTVTESSGFKDLDDATCRLIMERARFDMSSVPVTNTQATYSQRVKWQVPVTIPRVLLFGVTAKSVPVQSDATKTRCEYSDGITRIIEAVQTCDRKIALPVTDNKGKKVKFNIFNKYIEEVDNDKNAASAYNLSVILAENNYYYKSKYYLEKSSIFGNPLASASLCQMYGSKSYTDFVEFNPNQALEYCILSYMQGYNTAAISVSQKIISDYKNSLDKEIFEKSTKTIVSKKHDKSTEKLIPLNKIFTSEWYPTRDLQKKIGGINVAIVSVDKTGRVGTCLIAQSTYSYTLDYMVCRRLRGAALYTPAVIDGLPETAWTSETIRWSPENPNNPSTGNIIMQILLGVLGAAI